MNSPDTHASKAAQSPIDGPSHEAAAVDGMVWTYVLKTADGEYGGFVCEWDDEDYQDDSPGFIRLFEYAAADEHPELTNASELAEVVTVGIPLSVAREIHQRYREAATVPGVDPTPPVMYALGETLTRVGGDDDE